MKNCPRALSLDLYLEDELNARERRAIEAHLQACAACREALAERRLLLEAFSSLPPLEVPEDFALTVMDRLPEEARARWVGPLVSAAAAVIIGLLGFFWLTGENLVGVLLAFSRALGSGFGRLAPLAAKLLKVGALLARMASEFASALAKGLAALPGMLGPGGIGLALGLTFLLVLAVLLGAKRLLSVGEER